jgi:serine/threonine-protein kinase
MDTDRNLLFGVLALQADLIDSRQFLEACLLWTSRKNAALADLLVERGWIVPADREHVDYLLGRKLQKHGGDFRADLAAIPDDVKRSLAALGDDDIRRSLAGPPAPEGAAHQAATVDHVPGPNARYTRLRLHATGGIGRVWLAHDGDLGRDVALKELRPERAGPEALRARFLQEARITGQLEHPGVVPVYELAYRPDGQPFYTMRFVKGCTLSEAARAYHGKRSKGRADALDLPTLLNAFVTVCNTVAYAHSRGVIHRDLKGQNVILGDFGEVVVLDWGLAKLVGRPEDAPEASPVVAAGADSGYTVQGQALGTPAYMAPEQSEGRLDLIDRRTDVYGLGAILYEILTGEPPFTGPSTDDVLRRVREEEPIPPHQAWPDVPPALEALCLRALAKRPEDRPAAAADLAHEVQGWQEFERRKAEEALRESEALYHSLVESLPCSVWRKDLEGRFTFANQHFCDLFGGTLEQLVGKSDFDIGPRELAEKYRRDDQKVIATGGVFEDIEEQLSVGVQGDRYVHTLKTAVRDAAGNIIGTQGLAWDVTERKLAEEELRRSRERFELAVQGSQDGLWDWDVENDQVWYSERMRSMVGCDEQEFPNRPGETEKRVHPDDHARWRAVRDGYAAGGADHYELEYRMRHKDGSYRWVRDRGVTLRRADGKVYRVAGSREDITERKRSEEELAYEQYLLRSLMDTLPEGIYFKDRDGRLIRANRTVAETVGCSPAEMVGKTDLDLLAPEVARQNFEDEQEIIRTGRPIIDQEQKVTWLNGLTLWVSSTKMPLRDPDGNIIGTFGISRDITERKKAEEALRQSEERYRSVIAAMQDGILVFDAGGSIVSCNAAAERILGLSAEQIWGRTPHDPRWRSVLEDGSPTPTDMNPATVTLRTGKPFTGAVMGVHKPDGTLTWITVNAQPLFQADGRTLAGVAASFEDITDRKRTEEALRQTALELARLRQRLERDRTPCSEATVAGPGAATRSVEGAAEQDAAAGRGPHHGTTDRTDSSAAPGS